MRVRRKKVRSPFPIAEAHKCIPKVKLHEMTESISILRSTQVSARSRER
jgi:hypothetical protein